MLNCATDHTRRRIILYARVLVGVDGNLGGSIGGALPGEAGFSLAEWGYHPGGP
jgi:hypothetical protein